MRVATFLAAWRRARRFATVVVAAGVLAALAPSVRHDSSADPRSAGAAQEIARENGPPSQGTARLSGRVTSAATGAPIAGASVEFFCHNDNSPSGRTTDTDGDGRYQFLGISAGVCSVVPSLSGYVATSGATRERTLRIADGERIDGVDLTLTPAMAIAGRVLDERGRPLKGIEVRVARPAHRGTPPLEPEILYRAALTDDLGRYRISWLEQGTYYLRASVSGFSPAPTDAPPGSHAPTFYPGVVEFRRARPVRVAPGADATGIDFALARDRVVTLSGVVIDSHGQPRGFPVDYLSARPAATRPNVIDIGWDCSLDRDGAFTAHNLLPGSYTLRASIGYDAGRVVVAVGNRDVTGVVIRMQPGATAEGYVMFDGASPPVSRGIRVMAYQTDDGWPFWSPRTSDVDDTGTFRITGLQGSVGIRLPWRLPGWALAEIYLNGRDVTDEPVTFTGSERFTDLRVVLTDKTTHVRCFVTDSHGRPALAYVLIYASDQTLRGIYSRYRVREIVLDDRPAIIDGLPPGDYLAVAIPIRHEILFASDVNVEDYLQKLATPFTLHARDAKDVRLTLQEPPLR